MSRQWLLELAYQKPTYFPSFAQLLVQERPTRLRLRKMISRNAIWAYPDDVKQAFGGANIKIEVQLRSYTGHSSGFIPAVPTT